MKISELVKKLKKFQKNMESYKKMYKDSLDRSIIRHIVKNKEELDKKQKKLITQLVNLNPHVKLDKNIYYSIIENTLSHIKIPRLKSAILNLHKIIAQLKTKPQNEEITSQTDDILKEKLEKPPSFDFITINEFKDILKKNYVEIQKSIRNQCWKSAIILCGSTLEAILYDILKQQQDKIQKFNKSKEELENWTLKKYIDVATDMKLITKGAQKFSHTLRDYRNLIHPLKEVRGNYTIKKGEAETAFNVLKKIIIRDLKKIGQNGTS